MFGNPETTSGGRALKFYASVRLDIRRIDSIKQGNDIVGNRTRVRVVKNKVAPPFKQAEFDIMYGKGISKTGDILDVGSDLDIIEKSGAWYSYKEHRLGQGRENSKQFLEENPKICLEIENKIRDHYELPHTDKVVDKQTDKQTEDKDNKSTEDKNNKTKDAKATDKK